LVNIVRSNVRSFDLLWGVGETHQSGGGVTVVVLKNDLDTFCKYVVMRPPNVDHIVEQHIEDRHLEAAIRGIYYVARYRHRPAAGEAITVTLDQYCGRADPDARTNDEAAATARRIEEVDQRVTAVVAEAGAALRKGAVKYSGEIL
jgi:hypothetical protein